MTDVDAGHRWPGPALAEEVARLMPGDNVANIARRLGYAKVAHLVRNLENNGYRELAAKVQTRNTWLNHGGPPPPTQPQGRR